MVVQEIIDQLETRKVADKWNTLTESEKLLTVAKDVILLLESKRLVVQTGTMFNVRAPDPMTEESILKALLNETEAWSCAVCAKGAGLVVALLGLNTDQLTLVLVKEKAFPHWLKFVGINFPGNEPYITEDWLHLESAFEGFGHVGGIAPGRGNARSWYQLYPVPRVRLHALMTRVVENGGHFTLYDRNFAVKE